MKTLVFFLLLLVAFSIMATNAQAVTEGQSGEADTTAVPSSCTGGGSLDTLLSERKFHLLNKLAYCVRILEEFRGGQHVYPPIEVPTNWLIASKTPLNEMALTDSSGIPWSLGYWICPESAKWYVVCAFDGNGCIFATADNLVERQKK